MARYRVWVQVERADKSMQRPVVLGPPEPIFEAETRKEIIAFMRTLPGKTPEMVLNELKRRPRR